MIIMTRETKDPTVRRNELIDIAITLFARRGYESTTVADIVKKAHVAQGTFYYYFKSKDEILDGILDRTIKEVEEGVKSIMAENTDAVTKTMKFFDVFYSIFRGREKIYNYLHKESNALLHLRTETRVIPIILPPFVEIIQQGVEEGAFDTEYPHEAAVSIIGSIDAQYRAAGVINDLQAIEKTLNETRIIRSICDTIERILGAESGTFMARFQQWGKRE
jgi:AcrR family transcriptional regulator